MTAMDGGARNEPKSERPISPYGIPWQAAMISDRPGRLGRLLGMKFRDSPRSYRMRWGEFSWRWGLALEIANFGEENDWSLIVQVIRGKFYIHLPFLPRREPKGMLDSWGFSWSWDSDNRGTDIHFRWGSHTKIIYLPWEYVHVRSDMLCDDGIWRTQISYYDWHEGDARPALEAYDYKYVCHDGIVQDDITAVISIEEMEWRWKLAKWLRLPWPRRIRRLIEVTFNKEVGERRGSWKGGVTGCGYEMRPNEMPADTLHRMRRDRRFD
jgi:hypothetical protein